jgi:hypothetical protein
MTDLKNVPKVENMTSPRSNRPVANQYIITGYSDNGELYEIFQSYRTIIAVKYYGKNPRIVLDESYWDYSRTTGKYRNRFLGEMTAETRKKIRSGEYTTADLN